MIDCNNKKISFLEGLRKLVKKGIKIEFTPQEKAEFEKAKRAEQDAKNVNFMIGWIE